ncbi:MAG TPA: 4-hydroxy-tetrahydrodipicolinate synthase [Acidimicrobiales bacterium]|nr:4-hydroxy-tetrahydrodipicolinate synthase [Acidimicrobiales bacterium]
MGTARFGKVLTAMVTPFTSDGSLDAEGAADVARWLVDHGSDGLVLAGTTGEAPTLDDDEKLTLWRTVRAAVDVPLLAGAGTNDTRHSVELARRAAETGVDGLLLVTPYYNRPPQAGIDAHFRAIAGATDLPVVLYDVPIRTARRIDTEVLIRLAREVPTIVGLKDAAGDPGTTARVIAEAGDDFDVYSGDDAMTLALLGVGAVGVIGVATHWAGDLMAEMIAAYDKGDLAGARQVNARMAPSFGVEVGPSWVQTSAAKAALAELGVHDGPCRLPLPPVTDDARAALREVLTGLGLLR